MELHPCKRARYIAPPNSQGEVRMNGRSEKMGFLVLALVLSVGMMAASPAFAAKGKTFTGTVSDAMCGASHAMAGDAAHCTRACVSKGSKYALVIGDKVYSLDTTDKTALDTLDKEAGNKVTVTGTDKGDTIAVSSVMAAK
jgi:hypothetical protein